VGKSTPHPGKKKSCKEYTPLQDIIIQNIIIRKKTKQKQPRQGFHTLAGKKKSAQLGNYKAPQQAKKTQTAQAG